MQVKRAVQSLPCELLDLSRHNGCSSAAEPTWTGSASCSSSSISCSIKGLRRHGAVHTLNALSKRGVSQCSELSSWLLMRRLLLLDVALILPLCWLSVLLARAA